MPDPGLAGLRTSSTLRSQNAVDERLATADVVTDPDGDPLEATISALGQPYAITPDPDTGGYVFWLDEGRYTLQATAEGYATERAIVDVVARRGTTHDFTLKPYQMFLPVAASALAGQITDPRLV